MRCEGEEESGPEQAGQGNSYPDFKMAILDAQSSKTAAAGNTVIHTQRNPEAMLLRR